MIYYESPFHATEEKEVADSICAALEEKICNQSMDDDHE